MRVLELTRKAYKMLPYEATTVGPRIASLYGLGLCLHELGNLSARVLFFSLLLRIERDSLPHSRTTAVLLLYWYPDKGIMIICSVVRCSCEARAEGVVVSAVVLYSRGKHCGGAGNSEQVTVKVKCSPLSVLGGERCREHRGQ